MIFTWRVTFTWEVIFTLEETIFTWEGIFTWEKEIILYLGRDDFYLGGDFYLERDDFTWEEVILRSTWAFCNSFSLSESSFKVNWRRNLSSTSDGMNTCPIWKNFTSANTPLSFSVHRSALLQVGGQAVNNQTQCSGPFSKCVFWNPLYIPQ